MKKRDLTFISLSAIVLILIFAVAGLWIKVHLVEITQAFMGKEMKIKSMGIKYLPSPFVILKSFEMENKDGLVQAPLLKLYPDLKSLFRGKFYLKEVILEDPLLLANYTDSPVSNMPLIPAKRVQIKNGKVVFKDKGGKTLPLAVTGEVENNPKGLSLKLKSASIKEIGLNFSGEVTIGSFHPLKLTAQAVKTSLNPSELLEFLIKFGYLKRDKTSEMPKLEYIEAEGLHFEMENETGIFRLSSKVLQLDQNQLNNVTLFLTKEGSCALSVSQGVFNIETLHDWLIQNPEGKKVIDVLLKNVKLQSVTPNGKLRVSDLKLDGTQSPSLLLNGAFDIQTTGLKLFLTSEKGEKQTFTIKALEATVTLENNKPAIEVDKLQFASSGGGKGEMTAFLNIPFRFEDTSVNAAIHSLNVFNHLVDLDVHKERKNEMLFNLNFSKSEMKINAAGSIRLPHQKEIDLDIALSELRIKHQAQQKDHEENFDLTFIKNRPFSVKGFIKNIYLNQLPPLENVNFSFNGLDEQALLNGTFHSCHLDFSIETLFLLSGDVVAQIEGQGLDVSLTSLIACFSKELPIHLSGRLFMKGNLFTRGRNALTLFNTAEGEIMTTVKQVSVYKLSNLNPHLGFLLDILRVAGVNPHEKDQLFFDKGFAQASLQKDKVVFDSFLLKGPLFSTWGKGDFFIEDKRLKLTGHVRSILGFNKLIAIERKLANQKTHESTLL